MTEHKQGQKPDFDFRSFVQDCVDNKYPEDIWGRLTYEGWRKIKITDLYSNQYFDEYLFWKQNRRESGTDNGSNIDFGDWLVNIKGV